MHEIIETLNDCEKVYFTNILKNIPYDIESTFKIKKIKKNQVLADTDSKIEFVYLLLSGQVKVINMQPSGDLYTYAKFESPEFLGEFEVFGEFKNYRGTLITLEDCVLIAIPVNSFISWMKQDKEALFMRTTAITRHLIEQVSRERDFLFLSGMERLILYFCSYYNKFNRNDTVFINFTNEQISNEIGFSLKTVNRCIKKLKDEKLICFNGRIKEISKDQYKILIKKIDHHLILRREIKEIINE